ncbi:MAG: hypothetical protein R6V08_00295 [Desulfuromonadales bacterium]
MTRLCKNLLLPLLLLALSGVAAGSEESSSIDKALEAWSGERTVLLRTGLDDPLSSSLVQDLLAELVSRGYEVSPAPLDALAEKGLILDVRDAGDAHVLALIRADEGTIIAYEKRSTHQASPVDHRGHSKDLQPAQKTGPSSESCLPPGLNELDSQPHSVALLDARDDRCSILVLNDDALLLYRASPRGLEKTARFPAPEQPSRALHLDAGDIDSDGEKEIAVVWGKDEKSIYEGADTRIHSWILHHSEGGFTRASEDLQGYLRITGENGYFQRRGRHTPFAGEVFSLTGDADGFTRGATVDWPDDVGLYESTPIGDYRAFLIGDENRLGVMALGEGSTKAFLQMPETLGTFKGPEIAIRREEAEYRLGLSKEDQIRTDYIPLPRPVAMSQDGDVYTVRRGRTEGIPLLSGSAGKDDIVRIVTTENGPDMLTPFDGISAFILDFALLETGEAPSALLLVNEKPDGDGTAYLTLQTSPVP